MARRPDSTLAWLATGLVVLTFPFVARATFDEYDGGDDAPILDAGPQDATPPPPDGSKTTFGDDAGGISCATRHAVGSTGTGADDGACARYASCAAVGAMVYALRRARGRRAGRDRATER